TQSLRNAFVQPQLHCMIGGVAGAVRTERVVLLIEIAVLRKRSNSLIDKSREGRIGQLDTGRDSTRTGTVREAGDIHRQVTAQREVCGIYLVRNYVQCNQVGPFATDVSRADKEICRDLPLDIEVPRLHIGWTAAICGNKNDSVASILPLRCKRPKVR